MVYVCICSYTGVYLHTSSLGVYLHVSVCVHAMCAYMYICMYVYVYMYVYIYICVYMYIYIYICVCICVYGGLYIRVLCNHVYFILYCAFYTLPFFLVATLGSV